MDNKIKYAIIALAVIIIAIIAASSMFGNTTDDDPTHIVLTVPGHTGEPETGFNPLTGWGNGHLNYNPLVQSTLFGSDENGSFVNDLATDYSISSDRLTWTVKIRDDVKFTNGEKLTANDVAFTFNEAKVSDGELDLTNLEEAKAVDDTTVEFKLSKPQSTFIYDLRYVGIVPEKDYNNETYGANPIGSGPYKLKQWDKGQQAIFEYNDEYYGKEPYFKQITMVFPEEDNILQLVKSGQIDVAEVPISAYNESIDGYKLVEFESPRAQGLSLPYLPDTGLTTADGGSPVGNNVTSDPAIRKALNIGINREAIVESVYKGFGKPEYTGVDSLPFGNEQAKVTDNQPDEAKKILEEAGWVDTDGDGIREKDGVKASFEVYYPPNKQDRQSLATIISEQAKDLGIEIVIQSADWDTIYTKMYSQAVVMQQSSDNPYSAVYQQYHSKTPEELLDSDYRNPNAYNSSEVDAILEQGMNAGSLQDAYQYWSKAAYTGSGAGFGPNADSPWLWAADNHYGYFVKDNINMGTLSKLGQDYYVNILDWTRDSSSS